MSVKFSDNLNDPGSIAFESMRNGLRRSGKSRDPALKVAAIRARTAARMETDHSPSGQNRRAIPD
jgi:hypothetical protein